MTDPKDRADAPISDGPTPAGTTPGEPSADRESAGGDRPDMYYVENGCVVFTEAYHLARGYCCGSGCRHCPYEGEDKRVPTDKRGRTA